MFYKMLLSITKLQNLKAIHNKVNAKRAFRIVVINRKNTKLKNNSQPSCRKYFELHYTILNLTVVESKEKRAALLFYLFYYIIQLAS